MTFFICLICHFIYYLLLFCLLSIVLSLQWTLMLNVLMPLYAYIILLLISPYVFFFSSRRRHTRCLSDWSSDVCSSDLQLVDLALAGHVLQLPHPALAHHVDLHRVVRDAVQGEEHLRAPQEHDQHDPGRSEERRVGKEWKSHWARYHLKEQNQETITTVS